MKINANKCPLCGHLSLIRRFDSGILEDNEIRQQRLLEAVGEIQGKQMLAEQLLEELQR